MFFFVSSHIVDITSGKFLCRWNALDSLLKCVNTHCLCVSKITLYFARFSIAKLFWERSFSNIFRFSVVCSYTFYHLYCHVEIVMSISSCDKFLTTNFFMIIIFIRFFWIIISRTLCFNEASLETKINWFIICKYWTHFYCESINVFGFVELRFHGCCHPCYN